MLMLLKPAQNIYAVVLYLIGLNGRSEQDLKVFRVGQLDLVQYFLIECQICYC